MMILTIRWETGKILTCEKYSVWDNYHKKGNAIRERVIYGTLPDFIIWRYRHGRTEG